MQPQKEQTILIVDDDRTLLESMQILLEDEGYRVFTSIDGKSLNAHLEKNIPDIILLDLRLPGEDGESIALRLKRNPKTAHIPIIMVSANHNAEAIARRAATEDFISKPFDIEEMLTKVKKYLASPQ